MSESSRPPGADEDGAERDSIPLLLSRLPLSTLPSDPESGPEVEPERATRTSVRPEGAPPMAGVRWQGTAPKTARRIGAIGTLVAALLVFVAVFADMFASDRPIACKVEGHVYLFPNVTHTAVDTSRAEWKIEPLVAHGPSTISRPLASPGAEPGHPFGTDRLGRDVFARVVHGTRSYLVFALGAMVASILLGIFFGALAGLFGGATDALVSRGIESVSAFPPLVLVLGIQAAVPTPTLLTLFLAIALTRWPEIARLVRGQVILASTRDYALAARALGATPLRVLRRHIMPNVRGPLIIAASIGASAVVLTEASLDFLRIGVPTGASSWGGTMSEFRDAPGAWWLLAFPGLFIVATVIALTLLGEALRARLDRRS